MSSTTSSNGQRRLAYQCLKCLHRDNKVVIEARYRVLNHYLKKHVSLDAVPFYCKWCLFVAFKKEDLERHVTGFPKHRAIMAERGMAIDTEYLVRNRNPYVITERDVVALSSSESLIHWNSAAKNHPDTMAQAVTVAFPNGIQEDPLDGPAVEPLQMLTPEPSLAPTTPQVDVTQQPLQQLMSILVAAMAKPAATAPEYVPQETQEQGVLSNLPTREECRALAPEENNDSASSSSTASSSASSQRREERAEERHTELMKAVAGISKNLQELHAQSVKQSKGPEQLAKVIADLSETLAKEPSSAAPAAVPPPFPPFPFFPFPPTQGPAAQQSHPTERRDRSPIRVRTDDRREIGKENRRPEPRRDNRGKDRRVVRR